MTIVKYTQCEQYSLAERFSLPVVRCATPATKEVKTFDMFGVLRATNKLCAEHAVRYTYAPCHLVKDL